MASNHLVLIDCPLNFTPWDAAVLIADLDSAAELSLAHRDQTMLLNYDFQYFIMLIKSEECMTLFQSPHTSLTTLSLKYKLNKIQL